MDVSEAVAKLLDERLREPIPICFAVFCGKMWGLTDTLLWAREWEGDITEDVDELIPLIQTCLDYLSSFGSALHTVCDTAERMGYIHRVPVREYRDRSDFECLKWLCLNIKLSKHCIYDKENGWLGVVGQLRYMLCNIHPDPAYVLRMLSYLMSLVYAYGH